MRFQGKTALVTGGARGIGAATAKRFADEGATVVVADFDKAAAEETAAAIGGVAVTCDVTSRADVEAAVAAAVGHGGWLDMLVTCAGIIRDNLLHKMSDEDFDAVIDTHLKGTFYAVRAAQKQMVEQKRPIGLARGRRLRHRDDHRGGRHHRADRQQRLRRGHRRRDDRVQPDRPAEPRDRHGQRRCRRGRSPAAASARGPRSAVESPAEVNGAVTAASALTVTATGTNHAMADTPAGAIGVPAPSQGSSSYAHITPDAKVAATAASTAAITISGTTAITATGTNLADATSNAFSGGFIGIGWRCPRRASRAVSSPRSVGPPPAGPDSA